jgi:cytosine/uracil/thiamine/allantoin permease
MPRRRTASPSRSSVAPSTGVRGAYLTALLRAFIASGWFGIQTWIGGHAWILWLSFAFFCVIQMIQPWRLISDPKIYIFTWLGFYGGVLASVAGVLIAGTGSWVTS